MHQNRAMYGYIAPEVILSDVVEEGTEFYFWAAEFILNWISKRKCIALLGKITVL